MSKKNNARTQTKEISLCMDEDEIRFKVSLKDFHTYQNKMNATNKITPSDQFLTSCVHPEDQETLIQYLDQGYAYEMAATLADEFRPEVNIKVKPLKSASAA